MSNFEFDAVVEIPYGSEYKYEVDKKTGTLTVDRPLPSPLKYNYGYVPNTLHADGDPLDVCIVDIDPIYPLSRVKLVLVGAFICTDNGCSDDKLVAYVKGNGHVYDGRFLDKLKNNIKNYLSTYKEGFVVEKFVDAGEAEKILMTDIEAFLNA